MQNRAKMYHFVAKQPAVPIVLANKKQISGSICQYLRDFQIEAIRFLNGHFAKHEACILNDESGLGKTATVAAFLGAIAPHKKTLIVVQNDDDVVRGWRFHLNAFTELTVAVMEDSGFATDTAYNVCVGKWATLQTLEDLSKIDFNIVILDNRGQMLNNNFCTSMLLKHYEGKVKLILSSVDVTSDIKLLHNVLRLGGLLERQYESFKAFESKFKLPDMKEIVSKKVELEDYFLKREILINYCRKFRLRRYCHQYEHVLPLVDAECYKRHLEQWVTTSANDGTSDVAHRQSNCKNPQPVDNETEELFEEFLKLKKKTLQLPEVTLTIHMREAETITIEDLSEESPIVMSPLLFISDSETEDNAALLEHNNVVEVVDLTTDENLDVDERQAGEYQQRNANKDFTKNTKLILEIETGSHSIENENTIDCSQRLPPENTITDNSSGMVKATINRNSRKPSITQQDERKRIQSMNEKAETAFKCTHAKSNKENVQESIIKELTITKQQTRSSKKIVTAKIGKILRNKSSVKRCSLINETPANSPITKNSAIKRKHDIKDEVKTATEGRKLRSSNRAEATIEKRTKFAKKSTKIVKCRKMKPEISLDCAPENMYQTRRMQRLTRSTSSSKNKYMLIDTLGLENKIRRKKQKKRAINAMKAGPRNKGKETNEATTTAETLIGTQNADVAIKDPAIVHEEPNKVEVFKAPKDITAKKNGTGTNVSQQSILPSSSEYEEIECGQKFVLGSSASSSNSNTAAPIAHPTRNESNVALLSLASLSNGSELAVVPITSTENQEVITLSSSLSGSHSSQFSQSRRTRALKPNKVQAAVNVVTKSLNKSDNLGKLFNTRRYSTVSPDLFSSCSDVAISCTQIKQKSTFEGLKIYGSEVKLLQQRHAKAASVRSLKNCTRERSCLDILEKMFEPRTNADNNNPKEISLSATRQSKSKKPMLFTCALEAINVHSAGKKSAHPSKQAKAATKRKQINTEDTCEIANNATCSNIPLLNANGQISPTQTQYQLQSKQTQTQVYTRQNNKITNYLIGGAITQAPCIEAEQEHAEQSYNTPRKSNEKLSGTTIIRKSPKSPKSRVAQATKLTRWFLKNHQPVVEEQKDLFTTVTETTTNVAPEKRIKSRSTDNSRLVKRRRLDLSLKN